MFKFKPSISFLVLFILFNSSTAGAAFIYDESISGDLFSTDIGTLTTDSIIKGSLDGGTTSNPKDGPDEMDTVIFRIDPFPIVDPEPIDIEMVALSLVGVSDMITITLRSVPSSDLPNTVIIRPAAVEVYARILPGEYEFEFAPVGNVGSIDYELRIRTRASVSEPSSLFLIALGLIGLFAETKKTLNIHFL